MNTLSFSGVLPMLVGVSVLFLVSCSSKFDHQLLIGTWEVSSWTKNSDGRAIEGQMDMTFENDGHYNVDYGTQNEIGKYWVYGEFLHTVETGATEKKVKIINLTRDTLTIQMNRAGSLEEVILVRKK